MRSIVLGAALFAAQLMPAIAQNQERSASYDAAAGKLAIANLCRTSLGDQEVFNAAFALYRDAARADPAGLSPYEIEAVRSDLLQIETSPDPENPFTKSFCKELRKDLLGK